MLNKKRISKKVTRARTRRFNLLNFNKDDTFFWDITKFTNLIYGIFDLEEIKPNENEILFIKNKISELDKVNNNKNEDKQKKIEILPLFKSIFDSISSNNISYSDSLTNDIKNIIDNYEPSKTFYIKTIQKDLIDKKNNYSSNKKIYNILKKKLGFRFLNTTIKNKSLDKNKSKRMTFMFIKVFIRSIQMGISPIFIDETGLMIENNCYRRWRLPKLDYNIGPNKNIKKKVNLLLAVSSKNVIFEKFTNENTNQDIFIDFLNK